MKFNEAVELIRDGPDAKAYRKGWNGVQMGKDMYIWMDEFVEIRKKVPVRDYLKNHAVEYLNALNELQKLETHCKMEKERLKGILTASKEGVRTVNLTPKIIELLKKDVNAYNLIKEAFPELLEDD